MTVLDHFKPFEIGWIVVKNVVKNKTAPAKTRERVCLITHFHANGLQKQATSVYPGCLLHRKTLFGTSNRNNGFFLLQRMQSFVLIPLWIMNFVC